MDQSFATGVSTLKSQASDYENFTPTNGASTGTNHSPLQFRRPFGCAVLELAQLRDFAKDHVEATKEHTMPIFVPTNEAVYSMLHQDIIGNNTKEFEKSPRYAP